MTRSQIFRNNYKQQAKASKENEESNLKLNKKIKAFVQSKPFTNCKKNNKER